MRAYYFFCGTGTGYLILQAIKHIKGFDDHVSWKAEVWYSVGAGVAALCFSELRIAHVEFKFPHKGLFRLRHLINNFIRKHSHIDEDEKAKVALSLIVADKQLDDFEFTALFADYVKLLSAATVSTEQEWFATYRLPLSSWKNISDLCFVYFKTLKRCRVAKHRVVVRPVGEVDQINYDSDIVKETLDSGAYLYKLADNEGGSINDYALFDNKLVIMATPHGKSKNPIADSYSSIIGPESEVSVRILRNDDKIGPYINLKKRLLEANNVERYTQQGLKQFKKQPKPVN